MLAFLLVFGLVGGWILAGRMLAPLTRITDATRMAATGSLSHRIRLPGRNDEFRELADSFDAMLARLEAHVAEQQRFAANASHELRTPLAITQTLLDVARNDPNRDTGELVDRLHAVNTRAIDLTEALLLLSRADQRSFTREPVDLSLIAEEATETLLPLAEKHGVTIETSGDITPTIGSHALLLQMTTNLVHNAIVHNLPEHGTVWVTTSVHPESVVLTVENTGEQLTPAVGVHAGRAVPARHRTHTHRPRRCRPRPGDRREHHPGTRRNPHPHPPARRRAPRHGATPRRATAHRQVTISPASAPLRGRYRSSQQHCLPSWCRNVGRPRRQLEEVAIRIRDEDRRKPGSTAGAHDLLPTARDHCCHDQVELVGSHVEAQVIDPTGVPRVSLAPAGNVEGATSELQRNRVARPGSRHEGDLLGLMIEDEPESVPIERDGPVDVGHHEIDVVQSERSGGWTLLRDRGHAHMVRLEPQFKSSGDSGSGYARVSSSTGMVRTPSV